jgi:hypothetical protein
VYLHVSLRRALARTAKLQTMRETQFCIGGTREGRGHYHGQTKGKDQTERGGF